MLKATLNESPPRGCLQTLLNAKRRALSLQERFLNFFFINLPKRAKVGLESVRRSFFHQLRLGSIAHGLEFNEAADLVAAAMLWGPWPQPHCLPRHMTPEPGGVRSRRARLRRATRTTWRVSGEKEVACIPPPSASATWIVVCVYPLQGR